MKKLFVIMCLFLISCSEKENDKLDAMGAAQSYVEKQLKSPSTAKFSNMKSTLQYENVFAVEGSVDSQNSFGAMIRNDFSCIIEFTGPFSNKYYVKNFEFK
jgi:hypothetical protein